MKIKKGLLVIMLLMLSIPSITLAEENATVVEQQSKDWKEKREERTEEILQIVEKYSPEKMAEWKEAIAVRDELFSKIDKEEWRKYHKNKNEKQWKMMKHKKCEEMRELKEAAKNGNEEKVDEMLDNMLAKLKEHNKRLEEKTS